MDWTKRLMGKSDCRELLTLAVELALMAETENFVDLTHV